MAPSAKPFETGESQRTGARSPMAGLRFREFVTVALGLVGTPLGRGFIPARSQMAAAGLTVGAGFIYLASCVATVLVVLVAVSDLRETEARLRGFRPLAISSEGIRVVAASARSRPQGRIQVPWDEIQSSEILGMYEFRMIRDVVLVLAGGRRISTGFRELGEGLALARLLSDQWPGKCVFKEFVGGRSSANPFLNSQR
jgi:hypothetical protein